MSWEYRVMRQTHKWTVAKVEKSKYVYQIHEVYYHLDENNKIETSWTVNPIEAYSCPEPEDKDKLEGMRWQLEKMLEALDKPILDYETGKELDNDES